jgi:hypothetical protein
MNEQPLYETMIAAKLEQLPVPDMADAIWNRIREQLDTDMPSGDHNPPPPAPPRPTRPGRGRWGLLAAVAVLFLIYTINKQHQNTSTPPQIPAPARSDSLSPAPEPGIQASPGKKPGTVRQQMITPLDSLPGNTPAPMPDNAPPVLPPLDSIALPPPAPVINNAAPPKAKDSLPVRKPKGVRGITDSDYKIVPKPNQ